MHFDGSVVITGMFYLMNTSHPLLPVLVPLLNKIHSSRPAVSTQDRKFTTNETNSRHHPTPSVKFSQSSPSFSNIPIKELNDIISSCSTNNNNTSRSTNSCHCATMLNLSSRQ